MAVVEDVTEGATGLEENNDEIYSLVDHEEPSKNAPLRAPLSVPTQTPAAEVVLPEAPLTPIVSTCHQPATPRPLVHRGNMQANRDDSGDFISILKEQILQDPIRRDEKRKQSEENSRLQGHPGEQESNRQEQLMEVMILMMCGQNRHWTIISRSHHMQQVVAQSSYVNCREKELES